MSLEFCNKPSYNSSMIIIIKIKYSRAQKNLTHKSLKTTSTCTPVSWEMNQRGDALI